MRCPFDWALFSGGGDQVKMRGCGIDDVVPVGTIKQSKETVAPKLNGPGSDFVKGANLANHGSNAKDSGHFAAVRTLICRSTGYNVHSLAPIHSCWWNILARTPINT
jgi:hypothetical protein